MRIGQEGVLKIEMRSHLMIFRSASYVEELGSRLSLVAEFPDQERVVLSGFSEPIPNEAWRVPNSRCCMGSWERGRPLAKQMNRDSCPTKQGRFDQAGMQAFINQQLDPTRLAATCPSCDRRFPARPRLYRQHHAT